MDVEIVRSARRRKTVEARLVDGVLRVAMPAGLSPTEEEHWVGVMRKRFEQRVRSGDFDLPGRAAALAKQYDLSRPDRITWSDRQNTRWGSCTPADRSVRISRRLAAFPEWVIDYVIVHELAHLDRHGHDERFWAMVNRYPMAERARGYLMAKSDGRGRSDS